MIVGKCVKANSILMVHIIIMTAALHDAFICYY